MVARRAHNPKVVGSSPISATNLQAALRAFRLAALIFYATRYATFATLTETELLDDWLNQAFKGSFSFSTVGLPNKGIACVRASSSDSFAALST